MTATAWTLRRYSRAPAYYLGRPASLWITVITADRRRVRDARRARAFDR